MSASIREITDSVQINAAIDPIGIGGSDEVVDQVDTELAIIIGENVGIAKFAKTGELNNAFEPVDGVHLPKAVEAGETIRCRNLRKRDGILMDFSHMRVALVLSWKWASMEKAFVAIAANLRAPKLFLLLVDSIAMTIEIGNPCESLRAPLPVTRNPIGWVAWA